MIRTVLATAAIVIGITAVAAQSDPIKQRNGLMTSMWKDGFAAPYRMSKGRDPFDQAEGRGWPGEDGRDRGAVAAAVAAEFKAAARMPKTKYSSSVKIWDNKPDFECQARQAHAEHQGQPRQGQGSRQPEDDGDQYQSELRQLSRELSGKKPVADFYCGVAGRQCHAFSLAARGLPNWLDQCSVNSFGLLLRAQL